MITGKLKIVATASILSLLSSGANASVNSERSQLLSQENAFPVNQIISDLEALELSAEEINSLFNYLKQLKSEAEATQMSANHETETW